MPNISLRPIGQEEPVLTGVLVCRTNREVAVRFGPKTTHNVFLLSEWEIVASPLPTVPGTHIRKVVDGELVVFVLDTDGDWFDVSGERSYIWRSGAEAYFGDDWEEATIVWPTP